MQKIQDQRRRRGEIRERENVRGEKVKESDEGRERAENRGDREEDRGTL